MAPAFAAQSRESSSMVQLAQAGGTPVAAPASAVTVKSVERLAGSANSFAYAVKAGPWIFLNGHEAYDFERGLAPEVEGPPGHHLSGRPPLRREAEYILRRMRAILKDFGSDLPNAVRVDQYYTMGQAVHAYHLARFAEFGGYIPPSTSIIMERCFTARTNIHTSMLAIVPGPGWTIEKITLPGQAISASGYNPAVVVNDFVFVAGNQALRENGDLGAGVAVPPTRNWGGQNAFRRQVHYVIKERLEPSLKAAGSTLEQSLKAQVYIRGVNNFPDFIDVWSQYFRDIPCAVTLVPAKDYSSIESMLEINLIALKTGADPSKAGRRRRYPRARELWAMRARRRTGVPVRADGVEPRRPRAGRGRRRGLRRDRARGPGPGRVDPRLRGSGLQGRGRVDRERRARAILPDRHPGFCRHRERHGRTAMENSRIRSRRCKCRGRCRRTAPPSSATSGSMRDKASALSIPAPPGAQALAANFRL